MADVKISQLPAATSSTSPDLLVIVQSNVTKQITNGNLFTSTALTTPLLGTPTSGTLTNCTGLPVSTGISGLGANVATFLATPSSANLASAVTDETGAGSLVFGTAPTITSASLVTPDLGTPSSGTLTNCIGLPISTGVSGLGTGVATFLATPSSANLATAVTDETGTGALVFAGSPTFTGTAVFADRTQSGLDAISAAAPTIASAGTIAPTTRIAFVSGTTLISTITPPAPISTGGGTIVIIPTGLWTTDTAGNIALGTTAVVNRALHMTYDATTAKWYPSY